jgi:transcription initiation factor IIF auxiliary subunit
MSSNSLSEKRQRLSNTVIAFPIIYGSVAHWLGKKAVLDQATHKWTLFIKGPNNEDMSPFISKVAFSLHPSFPEPIRGKI